MTNPKSRGKGQAIAWICAHANHDGPGCLIWPFTRCDGYGYLGLNGKVLRATRVMCEMVNGPPPIALHQAAHSCGKGAEGCIHPKHLSWKTNGENQLDRYLHGTMRATGSRRILTDEQIAQLVSLKGKKTEMELAKMFGVSRSTIHYRLTRAIV